MEPLVIFGAILVVYCGYLAILDTTCTWRTARLKTAAKRKPAKKRTATVSAGHRRPRTMAGIPVGVPLLQKM
ncbi:MAG: hypothetical protein PHO83_15790 [Geobacteraceae bacterium]|nr:hypothetical protein [Geobacteraceae bacterium]